MCLKYETWIWILWRMNLTPQYAYLAFATFAKKTRWLFPIFSITKETDIPFRKRHIQHYFISGHVIGRSVLLVMDNILNLYKIIHPGTFYYYTIAIFFQYIKFSTTIKLNDFYNPEQLQYNYVLERTVIKGCTFICIDRKR